MSRLRERWRERADGSATELVEHAIVLLFAVLRIGLIIQMIVAVGWMTRVPAHSAVMVVTAAAIVFSSVMTVVVLRAGRIAAWPWGVADIAVGLVLMVVCGLLWPQAGAYSWAVGYTARSVPFVAAWHRSIWLPFVTSLSTASLFFWISWSATSAQPFSLLENSVDLPIYTIAAAVFARFARRVARLADENRIRAVELGAQLELARYQHHVHNATGLLARLARADTPPELLPSLRAQAGEESNRLRQELLNTRAPWSGATEADGSVSLASAVWDACAGFSSLPLEVRTGLGRTVRLPATHAAALRAAIVALLYNIQFHAHAEQVTVHADGDDHCWEVTVADDGVGFDPATTSYGFGLTQQVIASLADHGISTVIDAQEGEGTCITLQAHPSVPR